MQLMAVISNIITDYLFFRMKCDCTTCAPTNIAHIDGLSKTRNEASCIARRNDGRIKLFLNTSKMFIISDTY